MKVTKWLVALMLVLVFLMGLSASATRSARVSISSGTGFIVSSEGYVLTNAHVIDGAADIKTAAGGQEYSASVLESQIDKDLALLYIWQSGLPRMFLGDSDTVQIGDQVVAVVVLKATVERLQSVA